MRRNSIILASICLVAFGLFSIGTYHILISQERKKLTAQAELLIAVANSVREYTSDEVRAKLARNSHSNFIVQSVPAYAAVTTLKHLPNKFGIYSYRETSTNPMNQSNKAAPWEAELINQFADDSGLSVLTGERSIGSRRILYVASPIRVSKASCLSCHGDPEQAPASLLRAYNNKNGYGWKLGDVIGVQVGTVPVSATFNHTYKSFFGLIGLLLALLLIVLYSVDHALAKREKKSS